MFHYLNKYSQSRKCWALLLGTVISLEFISLYFQHISLLKPCILCIYQRCALFGIGIAGILAIIAPTITFFRIPSIFIWIYSAWEGCWLAQKHINIQLYPSPFSTCDLFVKFPNWLPLNQWWPFIFNSHGDCLEYKWHFLSLELSQWMLIIFISYLSMGLLICSAQLINVFNK